MAIVSLVEAEPLAAYRLYLRYSDGTEGDVDVSHLVGRGVFKAWEEPGVFESVRIGASVRIGETMRIGEGEDLYWGDDLDLCTDTLHLKLTGQAPEDVFPGPGTSASHA